MQDGVVMSYSDYHPDLLFPTTGFLRKRLTGVLALEEAV